MARIFKKHEILNLDKAEIARDASQGRQISIATSLGNLDFVLIPHDMRARNYRAEETIDDGTLRQLEPGPIRTFRGKVHALNEAEARFTVDEDTFEGVIITPDELYFIEPAQKYVPSANQSDFVLYKASDIKESFGTCGVTLDGEIRETGKSLIPQNSRDTSAQPEATSSFVIELATEADFEYVTAFGGSSGANNEILSIMNQVEGVYQSELGLTFTITVSRQHTWNTTNDPYSSTNSDTILDNEFIPYWNANFSSIHRDIAHMWTGKDMDGSTIGLSYVGVVCQSPQSSYGISQKLSNSPAKFIVTAHEIGHNFSAQHSDEAGHTECANTIMQSRIGSGFTFCQFSIDEITVYANAHSSCLIGLPDLTITAGTQYVTPTSVVAGSNVTAGCSEDNSGTATAGANVVAFYLSTDAVLTPGSNGDAYLGFIQFSSVAANNNSPVNSKNIQIPSGTAPGTYYFFFWADGEKVVSEFTDGNNFATRQLTVTPGAQNYTITVSASPSAGGTVSGGGTFAAGSSRTVTATANTGYSFTNWKENGSVVSSSASYNFTLNSNRNLVANFTASLLAPPTLVSPGTTTAPGSSIGTLTPTFNWQPVTGADGYALYVSRFNGSTYDLIFDSETDVGHPLAGTSYVLPSGRLQDGAQYRWNMSSHSGAGYGTPNTSRYYFNVSLSTCNSLGAFSLTSPSNGQSFSSTTTSVPLSWGVSPNADSYDVYFGTSSNPPFLANRTVTNRNVTVTPGQYWWKVVAKVNCGSATVSTAISSFSVQQSTTSSVQFSSATYSVNENGGSRTITVTRTGGTNAFIVNYGTSNGTATAGTDYTGFDEVLSFATNETSKTFTVPIINDSLVEGNENLNLTLSNPTGGATVGSPSTAVLTIVDDDTACTYSISESEHTVSPDNTSVNFFMDAPSGCAWTAVSDSQSWLMTSSSGSGDGTISYNTAMNPSSSPRVGHITVGGQVHTVTQIGVGGAGNVRFSTVTYTSNEGGGDATIIVTRTGGTGTGSVQYSTSNGTATAGTDYVSASGTLLFAGNETSKSFNVTILDDTTFEGNESISLSLINNSSSLTLGTPNKATLTISDYDVAPDSTGPNLSINSHGNGQIVSSSVVTLFGTASDSGRGNNGISSVTVNGVAASGGTASGSGTANWSRSLTLSPGANNITVVARDNSPSRNSTTKSITLNYQPVQNYTIAVSASPSAGGTVSGGGTFAAGSSRTVTATAKTGYSFANWTENGSVASSSASYTFTLNGNRTLVANFSIVSSSTAVYDSTLKAPKCPLLGSVCDSGTLINGRGNMTDGAEPNQPNTIYESCLDATSGTYHSDESIDKIRVSTLDGSNFAPGKTIKIEVTVWVFGSDHLDLYYAADATNLSFSYIATLEPANTSGAQVLSTTFTLPSGGSLQAVRAHFRYEGEASVCGTGKYDDHDDLVFAAVTGVAPGVTTTPATFVTGTVATLNGSVDPNGSTAKGWFEWGTSPTLATYEAGPLLSLGSGSTAIPISIRVGGFNPGTTYYFRAAGSNAFGTSRGNILSFRTGAAPSLRVNSITVTEKNTGSNTTAAFTVSMYPVSSQTVTVKFATANGSAAAPADYTARALTTLTFLPGQTSKTVNVVVIGDALDETNETFRLLLSSPTNATVSVGQGVCTILDNDLPPNITIDNATVTEPDTGVAYINFAVRLSAPSGRPVSVKYATANGTAAAGPDYTAVPLTTLTFQPGQTVRTFRVAVIGDTGRESNETFFINLSGAVNTTITDAQGLGTILNDD